MNESWQARLSQENMNATERALDELDDAMKLKRQMQDEHYAKVLAHGKEAYKIKRARDVEDFRTKPPRAKLKW